MGAWPGECVLDLQVVGVARVAVACWLRVAPALCVCVVVLQGGRVARWLSWLSLGGGACKLWRVARGACVALVCF